MLGLELAKLGAIDRLILVIGLATFSLPSLSFAGVGLGTGGIGEIDFARLCSFLPDETLALLERKERVKTAAPWARCSSGEMIRSWIISCLSGEEDESGDCGFRMCRMSLVSYICLAKLPLVLDPVVGN